MADYRQGETVNGAVLRKWRGKTTIFYERGKLCRASLDTRQPLVVLPLVLYRRELVIKTMPPLAVVKQFNVIPVVHLGNDYFQVV